MNNNYEKIWNENLKKDYQKINNNLKVYDTWLSKFDKYIDDVDGVIVDLGCGLGYDTLYLTQKKKKVLSVDFSEDALKILKENIPEANILNMDMANDYKLKEESTSLIVSSLAIHYFDHNTTIKLIDNIITDNSCNNLIETDDNNNASSSFFRVNSINDINYGANSQSKALTTSNIYKRFFDKSDIEEYFKNWEILHLKEEVINTKIHNNKVVIECVVKKSREKVY